MSYYRKLHHIKDYVFQVCVNALLISRQYCIRNIRMNLHTLRSKLSKIWLRRRENQKIKRRDLTLFRLAFRKHLRVVCVFWERFWFLI